MTSRTHVGRRKASFGTKNTLVAFMAVAIVATLAFSNVTIANASGDASPDSSLATSSSPSPSVSSSVNDEQNEDKKNEDKKKEEEKEQVQEQDDTPKKVFVCKYVGTPGDDERLQTGQNPISVSVNAIQNNQWDGTVPGWFSDSHDRSYVIAYDTGQPEPSVADCPSPEEPEVDYCDRSEKPGGVSIATWLKNNGIDPADCFEYEPVQQCGEFTDMKITKSPEGISYGFQYAIGADQDTVYPGLYFPATFDEDEGGGSVQITVWMAGGEKDYVTGTDIPNFWDNNGKTFTVDTDCAPPPPVVEQCTTYDSVHTTDLSNWDLSQTRSTGHNELVEDGLKIWTEGATSTDKAAGYYSTNFPLSGLGTETIAQMLDYTSDFGITPGLQLVVDFDNNGSPDGILVGEAVYGNSWWLSNSAAQFVKDDSPNTGGGYGSSWYGTPNEWLESFPDAQVKAIGYSLGSGVHASGVISQITVGCVEYTFDYVPEPPEQPEPKVINKDWVDEEWKCGDTTTTQTREVWTVPYIWNEGDWEWELNWNEKTVTEETQERDLTEQEIFACPENPGPKVEYTDWVDEEWKCDDTTTTQTRTKIITTYAWDEELQGYVVDDVNNDTEETQERDLTEQEIFACPEDEDDPEIPTKVNKDGGALGEQDDLSAAGESAANQSNGILVFLGALLAALLIGAALAWRQRSNALGS